MFLVGSLVLVALAGCGRWFAEREPWRREAEIACLKSGAVKEGPAITQVQPISGPGICGADFPLKVAALGEAPALGFADTVRPPADISALLARMPPPEAPDAAPSSAPVMTGPRTPVPLRGPTSPAGAATRAIGPTEISPPATLACPLVSMLDSWLANAVQPLALRWFGQPVIEVKQISAYSCRGMNGQRGARISEHAFGNALDIAAFTLGDGRKVSVREGWHGLPQEQGFLRDVHASACALFSTVLAPGSNVFHYDHLHVDLMRREGGRTICNPEPIAGEVVAAQAGGRRNGPLAGRRRAEVTGSLGRRAGGANHPAVAGED